MKEIEILLKEEINSDLGSRQKLKIYIKILMRMLQK